MNGDVLMKRVAAGFEVADLRLLFDAIDDEIVWKSAMKSVGPFRFGGIYHGRNGIVQVMSQVAAAYTIRHFKPQEIVSSGDTVWGLFGFEGLHRAAGGAAEAVRPVRFDFAARWRLRRGRVVEHQGFFDTYSAYLQQTPQASA
jgi:ketosteroid isomerase-like protein